MKIELINENQIKCTLTREDMEDRQLKLSELAYGSEKAKELFRDMMQQAARDFGFETGDIPLMIEAIPVSTECILLVVTKVENAEELDARFSGLSVRAESDQETEAVPEARADDILDLFKKLKDGVIPEDAHSGNTDFVPLSESLAGKKPKIKKPKLPHVKKPVSQQAAVLTEITKLYSFGTISDVTKVAEVVKGFYNGENSLYRSKADDRYYLFLKKGTHTPEEYNKLCNIFAEYSKPETCTPAIEAFFEEHERKIVGRKALQVLEEL